MLDTRRLVLEHGGAQVCAVTSLAEMTEVPSDFAVELVILCHSLLMGDCSPALQFAESRWPRSQRLVLFSGNRGCHPGPAEASVDATRGPSLLIESVRQLLQANEAKNIHAT